MITPYLDLDVETKGIHKNMCFYITNIGNEDIFLSLLLTNHTLNGRMLL